MKVFEERPKKHAIVVRPEKGVQEYEVWVMEPKLIGHLTRLGTQRIIVEGSRNHFTNIVTAADFLCAREGVVGLDTVPSPFIKRRIDREEVLDMPGHQLWELNSDLFTRLLNRDQELQGTAGERMKSAVSKLYSVTREDLVRAGVALDVIESLFESKSK